MEGSSSKVGYACRRNPFNRFSSSCGCSSVVGRCQRRRRACRHCQACRVRSLPIVITAAHVINILGWDATSIISARRPTTASQCHPTPSQRWPELNEQNQESTHCLPFIPHHPPSLALQTWPHPIVGSNPPIGTVFLPRISVYQFPYWKKKNRCYTSSNCRPALSLPPWAI